MIRRRYQRQDADAVVWIAYTDFVTALALIFLAVAAVLAFTASSGPAVVDGHVRNAEGAPIDDCEINLDADRFTRFARSNQQGVFVFLVRDLAEPKTIEITARCTAYDEKTVYAEVEPGKSDTLTIEVGRRRDPADAAGPDVPGDEVDDPISVVTLAGDRTFERNEYVLTPGGIAALTELGRSFYRRMEPGNVLAIQGHTDDQPFPPGSGKNNWILSGERAAAAARIMIDSAGLLPCNIVIMGFGPSRPSVRIDSLNDPLDIKREKRAENRRIVFRLLEGGDVGGDTLGAC